LLARELISNNKEEEVLEIGLMSKVSRSLQRLETFNLLRKSSIEEWIAFSR